MEEGGSWNCRRCETVNSIFNRECTYPRCTEWRLSARVIGSVVESCSLRRARNAENAIKTTRGVK